MKTMPLVSATLALSALTLTPAFAAASASASSGPLVVSLRDLDLTDGITPSITFFQNVGDLSYVYVSAGSTQDGIYGTSGYDPISGTASATGSSGAGSVIGDGTALGTRLTAAATSADVYSLAPNTSSNGSGFSNAYGSFRLSGGTAAIFSINFTAQASGAGYYENPVTSSTYGERAEAGASIQVSGLGAFGDDDSYQESGDERGTFVDPPTSAPLIPYDRTVSQSLRATFFNLSNGDLTGDLALDTYAYSISDALPPVPEPGTHALLLAGLAAVGFVLRRKRA